MSLDEDLDAVLASKTDDPDYVDVELAFNGKFRTMRFTPLDGLEWAECAALCPANLKSPTDVAWGYNLRSMTAVAGPKSGRMRDGDDWIELSDEQWKKLLRAASGRDHRAIANALWNLNEWMPTLAVDAARKAFEAESAPSSSSPDNSESPTPA